MTNQVNLDALLDNNINDMEDLPSFSPFAPGVYKAVFSFGTKLIGENQCVFINLKHVETIQLNDEADTPPNPGDTSETVFALNNKYGEGTLKELSKQFLALQGKEDGTLREAFEPFTNGELYFSVTRRIDKKDPTKSYQGIKNVFASLD